MNEGDLIPNITLRSVDSDGMQNFNLVEHFQNKKVLVICVPNLPKIHHLVRYLIQQGLSL